MGKEEISHCEAMSTPASGEQMEVVATEHKAGKWDETVYSKGHVQSLIGYTSTPLVTLEAAQKALTAANERAERLTRELAVADGLVLDAEALNTTLSKMLEKARAAASIFEDHYERNICHHESTHRGGVIWTICDDCGMKWADDEGGFQPFEYLSAIEPTQAPQPEPHPDDLAVDRFASAMKAKLAKKRSEGRGGWDDPEECPIERLSYMLVQHLWKGDPVDVGNLAMMIQQRGGRVTIDDETRHITPAPAPAELEVVGVTEQLIVDAFLRGESWRRRNGMRNDDISDWAIKAARDYADTILSTLEGQSNE